MANEESTVVSITAERESRKSRDTKKNEGYGIQPQPQIYFNLAGLPSYRIAGHLSNKRDTLKIQVYDGSGKVERIAAYIDMTPAQWIKLCAVAQKILAAP